MTPDQMRRMRLRRMNLLMAYASFASARSAAPAAFTPASLFAAGEQGVWYDPSDLTTLYQDAAGTTPVTAVEQPVGLVLDKSGRGNHLSQSTAAARPVLSARVNLLTRTEEFDNAAWTKSNTTVTANQATAPNSTQTMDAVIETSSTSIHAIRQTGIAIPTGAAVTGSVFVKANGRSIIGIRIDDGANGAGKNFDLSAVTTGSTISVGTGASLVSSSITSVGDGVYLCVARVALPSGATTANFSVDLKTSDATSWTQTYLGDGTSGIYIWGADLRPANAGVGLPSYQRVGAATSGSSTAAGNADYDTTGFPLYLAFDGTDDGLSSASIDFSATDKMAVFAGVRRLSAPAIFAVIAELSVAADANNGAFSVGELPSSSQFYARGTVGAAVTSSIATPSTSVLTGTANISGDSTILRVNGVQATPVTTDLGTGNFGNYPLFIGRRNNATLQASMRLYSLIVLGRTATASEITNAETWVNTKSKAY